MRTLAQIQGDLDKAVGKGLEAAARSLVNVVKNVISIPAPRITVKRFGVGGKVIGKYYRARTRAFPGAPPRKLSGTLRRSITFERVNINLYHIGTNVKYARPLEIGKQLKRKAGHGAAYPFLLPTLNAYKDQLAKIIGDVATRP